VSGCVQGSKRASIVRRAMRMDSGLDRHAWRKVQHGRDQGKLRAASARWKHGGIQKGDQEKGQK
jgi:hypothetical protein